MYRFPSAGTTAGKPYTASLDGIGPTVVRVVWTVAYPDDAAAIVVAPGVKVDWNCAVAKV